MEKLKYISVLIFIFGLSQIHPCHSSPYTTIVNDDIETTQSSVNIITDNEISNDEQEEVDSTTVIASRSAEKEGGDLTAAADDSSQASPPTFLVEPEIGALQYAKENGIVGQEGVESTSTPLDISQYEGLTIKTFNGSKARYYAGRINSCQCGRPGRRIIGGEPAFIQEYPWTVVLYKQRFFFGGLQQYCGGTLINNMYVLTASHCVDGMIPTAIEVGVHDENLASTDELPSPTQMIKVERIIMHPDYNRRTIDNDIALLKLSTPVLIGEVNVPACLPAGNEFKFEGQNATAAGWGATSSGGSTSKTLQKVNVPVLTNEQCDETRYKGKITDNMLCAGYVEEGKKDSCQGDSGGPLIIENGGRRTLIGVVSWGYGCAEPNSPGVYTRVGRYPDWIVSNTAGAEWCSG